MPRSVNKTSRSTRPAKARVARTKVRKRGSDVPRNLVSKVCSITDPFCQPAWGAKFPDGSNTRTIPFTAQCLYTLTSDSAGFASVLLMPNWNSLLAIPASIDVFGACTYTVTQTGVSFPGNVSKYRIVSAGVQLQPIVSPLNASGLVYLRTFSPEQYGMFATINMTYRTADASREVSVSQLHDERIIFNRYGSESGHWHPPPTSNALIDLSNAGFQTLHIGVGGLPANTPAIAVRFIVHYEFVPQDSGYEYAYATPAAQPDLSVVQAANSVQRALGNFFTSTVNKVVHSEAAAQLARVGAGVIARYAGVPLLVD